MRDLIRVILSVALFTYVNVVNAQPILLQDPNSGCAIYNSTPLDGYSVHWSGECKSGKANGNGYVDWFLNATPIGRYEGDYVGGKMHGFGTYAMHDGSRYIGEFRHNYRHGHGAYLWADGTRYEGDFLQNKVSGKGTTYWKDGSFYIGEFNANQKHGFGQLSLVKNHPLLAQFENYGHWTGYYFVVQGVFLHDEFVTPCPTEAECVKKLASQLAKTSVRPGVKTRFE